MRDTGILTPGLAGVTHDQLKTFLPRGPDSTGTTISLELCELLRRPRAPATVQTRLGGLLGAAGGRRPPRRLR